MSTLNRDLALEYEKKKKRKKRAAIWAAVGSIGMAVFIIIAFSIIHVDRFTISIENDPSLCLTLDEKHEEKTTQLIAPPLLKAADTQYTYILEDLDESLGSKNTDYYFAYSFYLGGVSAENKSINYNLAMTLDRYSNSLEEAIRVMIIRNGEKQIYAKPNSDGSAKPIYYGEDHSATPEQIGITRTFRENKNIIVEAYEIKPGEFDKYTIVMWIDGWESVNEMKGGIFSANLKFSTNSIND